MSKKPSIKQEKKYAIKIAKDLNYSEEVICKLNNSVSIAEINRILCTERKRII